MTTVQYMSDLHFEFHPDGGKAFVDSLNPQGVDVLVLAGDIASGQGIGPAMDLICGRYKDAHVVYVHGNHEFYGSDRGHVVNWTREAVSRNDNLHWLDCSHATIDGRRFVGAPLWFSDPEPKDQYLKRGMNDFFQIRDFEDWVYFENYQAVNFFKSSIRPGDVVVTHHLPSPSCVSKRFADSPLNHFFVHDLDMLIIEKMPTLWIHGHTHDSVSSMVAYTPVRCNPYGYHGHEVNPAFRDGAMVHL